MTQIFNRFNLLNIFGNTLNQFKFVIFSKELFNLVHIFQVQYTEKIKN